MKIISLDQNAISYLVRREKEPFWREVKDSLIAGVDAGKLLCPVPPETIAETTGCSSADTRIKIRDLQTKLSAGFFFKKFSVIEAEETLALVRPGFRPFPYERGVWHSVEDDARTRESAALIARGNDLMKVRMAAFIPPPDLDKHSVRELRRMIITSRAADFFRQLERLINRQALNPADNLHLKLCRDLVACGATQGELEQLREKVLTHEWEAIPLLFFRSALSALLEYDMARTRHPRTYDPNDEADKLRISTGLHCSAIMIVERRMAALVKRLEGEWGESLQVYGINEQDAIKAALETALAA